MALFAGLMSGTSLDGVDGVIVDLAAGHLEVAQGIEHVHLPFEDGLRSELLALNEAGGTNELARAALAANGVARAYAEVLTHLLAKSGVPSSAVRAIGAHGQTVRHQPGAVDGTGYTIQLLNGALLAELSGIDVVCDLRSRDVAAGGQGAPLVPGFHAQVFRLAGQEAAVLNLGGMANLTLLGADGSVRGFDTGPGNALLDHWVQRHQGLAFDYGGQWAASGRVDARLLSALNSDPFFSLPPPKSTGRDLFDAAWLQGHLDSAAPLGPADVQATLMALTVRSVVDALQQHGSKTQQLRVCGGGAKNTALMDHLRGSLPGVDVQTTVAAGIAPEQVEALAFAWLASSFVERLPGNIPDVTGAVGPRLLGALYPA
jgi:anhydro-N-acetylmuramic acid kinase